MHLSVALNEMVVTSNSSKINIRYADDMLRNKWELETTIDFTAEKTNMKINIYKVFFFFKGAYLYYIT